MARANNWAHRSMIEPCAGYQGFTNFKHMKYHFSILIIFALILSSCSSYQNLYIDVLIPAKHSFKPEIKSVVLVNNSVPYRDSLIHKVELPEQKFTVDTIWQDDFSLYALTALKKELDQRLFFDSVYIHKESLKTDRKLKNRALSWTQVDSLCKQFDAQAIISFENYMYHTNIKVENLADGYKYGYLDANGAILWRAYNLSDKELIYKEVQADTISWDAFGGRISDIAREIPDIKEGLTDLANYMGEEAADHASPHWETQKRGYYNSGNYQFMQAAEFVRSEQWGEAIKLWKYVFDHTEKKKKSRAAYNLALASEIMGDYEAAGYWINEGAAVLGDMPSNTLATDKERLVLYAHYMDKRIKLLEDLKIQVGGFE